MTKLEFIKAIGEKSGVSQEKIRGVLSAIDEIVEEIVTDENNSVVLARGITLGSYIRGPRTARNPHSGETIDVPEKRVPRVKIGKHLKDAAAGLI